MSESNCICLPYGEPRDLCMCHNRSSTSLHVPPPLPSEPYPDDDDGFDWEDMDHHVDEVDRVEPLVEDERKWLER